MSEQKQNNGALTTLERAIDKPIAGGIEVSSKHGMVITSMAQAMEFAKLMSVSRTAVPKHLRENPGACLAIAVQAFDWQINPFALANKSYEVNDRICYESALYQAVVTRRAPIKGRIKMQFDGDGENRTCRVWADLADGSGQVDYVSPKFGRILPKNSPLWKNDPDQQLFYFSVRAFSRRHFPDVMMGIYTVDEIEDMPPEEAAPSTTLQSLITPKLTDPPPARTEPATSVIGVQVERQPGDEP